MALPQIRCQLHDHARQCDNDDVYHDDERSSGKLHGNISWNGYGNAIIGRVVAVLRKVNGGFKVPAKVAWYLRG